MAAEAEKRGELAVPEYVFMDELGDPYHPAQLTRYLHELQRRAGLPEITLHDLRVRHEAPSTGRGERTRVRSVAADRLKLRAA
jgi:hypothetical protein